MNHKLLDKMIKAFDSHNTTKWHFIWTEKSEKWYQWWVVVIVCWCVCVGGGGGGGGEGGT